MAEPVTDLQAAASRAIVFADDAPARPWKAAEFGVRPEDGPTSIRIYSEESGTIAFTHGYSAADAANAAYIVHAANHAEDLARAVLVFTGVLADIQGHAQQAVTPDGDGVNPDWLTMRVALHDICAACVAARAKLGAEG